MNDYMELEDIILSQANKITNQAEEIERLREAIAESCDENRELVLAEGPWSTDMCPTASRLSFENKALREVLTAILDYPDICDYIGTLLYHNGRDALQEQDDG